MDDECSSLDGDRFSTPVILATATQHAATQQAATQQAATQQAAATAIGSRGGDRFAFRAGGAGGMCHRRRRVQ
jgi:hypothetical protein